MAEFKLKSFNEVTESWLKLQSDSPHRLLFSSPAWSALWWNHFGGNCELHLGLVTDHDGIIGIAPLKITDGTVSFIGSDNVCDFLDFIIHPGKEAAFYRTLLEHLKCSGHAALDLSPVLPDSSVCTHLVPEASRQGLTIAVSPDDVTVGLDLPPDLPGYLKLLNSKQRHELLRKERRLHEEGSINYSVKAQAGEHEVETFLTFFRESREDKNKFLTDSMESFFRSVVQIASENQSLRLGVLELNSAPVAVTLCFEHKGEMYLYNSGYNPAYRTLSVGVLSKYFCIADSIAQGARRFDFLKGNEKYKFHLGGRETGLFRCIINI
jgi:CelD/BcsL family acetyltransferase involved in cellulose biosynthesis